MIQRDNPRRSRHSTALGVIAGFTMVLTLAVLGCVLASTRGIQAGRYRLLGPSFAGVITMRRGLVTLAVGNRPDRLVDLHEGGGTGYGGPAEPMRAFLQPGELAGVTVYYWHGWFLVVE